MILTKEVQVTIVPMNINNFLKLGYENLQLFKKATIKVQHLGKKSVANILVKCDICGLEKITLIEIILKVLKKKIAIVVAKNVLIKKEKEHS